MISIHIHDFNQSILMSCFCFSNRRFLFIHLSWLLDACDGNISHYSVLKRQISLIKVENLKWRIQQSSEGFLTCRLSRFAKAKTPNCLLCSIQRKMNWMRIPLTCELWCGKGIRWFERITQCFTMEKGERKKQRIAWKWKFSAQLNLKNGIRRWQLANPFSHPSLGLPQLIILYLDCYTGWQARLSAATPCYVFSSEESNINLSEQLLLEIIHWEKENDVDDIGNLRWEEKKVICKSDFASSIRHVNLIFSLCFSSWFSLFRTARVDVDVA